MFKNTEHQTSISKPIEWEYKRFNKKNLIEYIDFLIHFEELEKVQNKEIELWKYHHGAVIALSYLKDAILCNSKKNRRLDTKHHVGSAHLGYECKYPCPHLEWSVSYSSGTGVIVKP